MNFFKCDTSFRGGEFMQVVGKSLSQAEACGYQE